MQATIALDARSIGGIQYGQAIGTPGAVSVATAPVPPGMNRLILHASVTSDDFAPGTRKLALNMELPGAGAVFLPLEGSTSPITQAAEWRSLEGGIFLPAGWILHAWQLVAMTAGKSIVLTYIYIDVLQI